MNINYIEKDGKKLFSFHRHDFQAFESGEFIDGGWDYIRTNTDVESGSIHSLIEDIREQFQWGSNYEKDGITRREETVHKLLKDLDTDHIIAILIYLVERISTTLPATSPGLDWRANYLILLEELKFRDEIRNKQGS